MKTVKELADEIAQNKTVEAVEAFLKHIAEQIGLIKAHVAAGAAPHAVVTHADSLVAQIDAARGANMAQAARDEGQAANQHELPLDQQTDEPIDPRVGAAEPAQPNGGQTEAPAEDPPAAEEEPVAVEEGPLDEQPEETLA